MTKPNPRPPDWENTVLALRNVLAQLDGWQVQRILDIAQAMADEALALQVIGEAR